MKCPTCQQDGRKFGKDRDGNQRYQCVTCRKTFSDRQAKPLNEMRLPLDKALFCLQLLTEGNSTRATVRLSGVAKDTVTALLVCVGQKCEAFMREKLQSVPAKDVQADEIWSWVAMKEKTKNRKGLQNREVGDAWCFVAIERTSKVVLAWLLGKRDAPNTQGFLRDVEQSTRGRIQLTTDGFHAYPQAVSLAFDQRPVDFGTLVKTYGNPPDQGRYSPAKIIGINKTPCCGNPDPDAICTSHVERHNLSIRMQNRRLTRLTNAFSKKWANHEAALGLYFGVYNFVRPHGTLTKANHGLKTTPAMEAGLTDHPWTILELLTEATKSTPE
jgi:transposase-like protein/IS1 family transposase